MADQPDELDTAARDRAVQEAAQARRVEANRLQQQERARQAERERLQAAEQASRRQRERERDEARQVQGAWSSATANSTPFWEQLQNDADKNADKILGITLPGDTVQLRLVVDGRSAEFKFTVVVQDGDTVLNCTVPSVTPKGRFERVATGDFGNFGSAANGDSAEDPAIYVLAKPQSFKLILQGFQRLVLAEAQKIRQRGQADIA